MPRDDQDRHAGKTSTDGDQPVEAADPAHRQVEKRQLDAAVGSEDRAGGLDPIGLMQHRIRMSQPDGRRQRLAEQRVVVDDQEMHGRFPIRAKLVCQKELSM